MKSLSKDIRDNITARIIAGESCRKISRNLGVGLGTVARMRQEVNGNIPKPQIGRPIIVSKQDKRILKREILSGRIDNAVQGQQYLKNHFDITISAQTVRNILQEEGLKACVKVKKPLMSKINMRKRLEFAIQYQHWSVEDWKSVIFSDETKINRIGSDGRVWGYKKKGCKTVNSRLTKNTLQAGGGNIMVWGCMCWYGVGDACNIEGRLNGEEYVTQILNPYVIQSRDWYKIPEDKFIFQQDNAPIHNTAMARAWFAKKNIQVINWPPQSPDLNPIEHLWRVCKMKLNDYDDHPGGVRELWDRFENVWADMDPQICKGLIESIPRRLQAVIKAKGGPTKY